MIRPSQIKRVPHHVGLIPDGNRRWAHARGRPKHAGYDDGVAPGIELLELCRDLGIHEVSIYGFTKENVHRPSVQVAAFRVACVKFARACAHAGHALRVVGDMTTSMFPDELRPYAERAPGKLRVNLMVNYSWRWDLLETHGAAEAHTRSLRTEPVYATSDIPRLDLIIRWGGRQRLSGFLPIQSAYADIRVLDTLWPDMSPAEFLESLHWFERQEATMGG